MRPSSFAFTQKSISWLSPSPWRPGPLPRRSASGISRTTAVTSGAFGETRRRALCSKGSEARGSGNTRILCSAPEARPLRVSFGAVDPSGVASKLTVNVTSSLIQEGFTIVPPNRIIRS